jgi:hypothetical protein
MKDKYFEIHNFILSASPSKGNRASITFKQKKPQKLQFTQEVCLVKKT